MLALPVITALGGINSGGRSATLGSYRRSIIDSLEPEHSQATILELAALMQLAQRSADGWLIKASGEQLSASACAQQLRAQVLSATLVRAAADERNTRLPVHLPVSLHSDTAVRWAADSIRYGKKRILYKQDGWGKAANGWQRDHELDGQEFYYPREYDLGISVTAALPTGLDISASYKSGNHPRALQMALFAVSEALASSGLDIDAILAQLSPEQVAVYASNSIGQLDRDGWGGLLQSPYLGEPAHAKQIPLGYPQMCADFVNAYVLGSVGRTGTALGACATFLYNLNLAVRAIQSGGCQLAVVGSTDAPIIPEVMEGFNAMGALASDDKLQALAKQLHLDSLPAQHSSRPFGANCGFVMAESSQFIVLMSDALALATGAPILAAVPDCCVHADGYKKSIAAPGPGNYLSLGQACASLEDIIGSAGLRQRSFVQAHGTGTPVNRVTESEILSKVAAAFAIPAWEVVAAKTYYGHSQGSSSGDQLMHSIGIFNHGILPGISSIEQIADDVHQQNLNFGLQPRSFSPEHFHGCLLNSKGFGGNNASAALVSGQFTEGFLRQRHGQRAWQQYQSKLDSSAEARSAYQQSARAGAYSIRYRVAADHNLQPEVELSREQISIKSYPTMRLRRGLYS